MEKYPQLIFNKEHFRENVKNMTEFCGKSGIIPTWVVKGLNGNVDLCRIYAEAGAKYFASSRIEHLKVLKENGIGKKLQLLRIPMISEAEDVVRYSDTSLNSEYDVLYALNEAAKKYNVIHNVILMIEMGDLREGYYDREELIHDALAVENEFSNLHLDGFGMNVGCYGSIIPTKEKLEEFVSVIESVEEKLGRQVELISGGDSVALMRVVEGDMPKRVNEIRIGGEVYIANTVKNIYGYGERLQWLHEDVVRIRAEVIELKVKPTYPIGEMGVDAFANRPVYIDKGLRLRALLALGKFDIGSQKDLIVLDKGVTVEGGSSDHTILDVEEYWDKANLKVGSVFEFRPIYGHVMYMTLPANVNIKYV